MPFGVQRLIVALKLEGLNASPELHKELLEKARGLIAPTRSRLVDVRIGRRRIEIDTLTSNPESVVSALSSIAPIEYTREVEALGSALEGELVKHAVELFNDERFWETHETLERVWREKSGEEREVLSGLIKLAAAYVNLQKGKAASYFRLLEAALNHLARWRGVKYYSIDIEALRVEIRSMLEAGSPRFITMSVCDTF
ncbi:MAG: DUF309 domain-containing protein [Nitrososphaerota archaeon]